MPDELDHLRREIAQLRADIQREIDLRLGAEANARKLALDAFNLRQVDMGQIVTWVISVAALAGTAFAIFHGVTIK